MLKIVNTQVLTHLSLFLQKNCKTSVVFNVHFSNISIIRDKVYSQSTLKYITILNTWPGIKYSLSRVDPSRNL
jgi:hypothetical protein